MAPARGGGFMSSIRALDMYRKVPKDLTEASFLGGSVSLVAASALLILFIMEIRQFVSTDLVTRIDLDHSEDGVFQVNFNVTFPGLSCEFAAVDVQNVIGKRRNDIQDKTVHKYSLDGTWQGFAEADDTEHTYEGTNKDHYGNRRHAIELTASNFESKIQEFEAMLVDFHAPWCVHCQNLAPVYEHAAEMVKEKAPHQIDSHKRHAVALGTVDCTTEENIPLCRKNHIQAFPTVLVFRQGHNKAQIINPFLKAHESYHGARTANAISDFALKVLQEVIKGDQSIHFGGGTDSTGDGKVDSKVRTKGCRVEGFLMVQRVPGSIIFRPQSKGHTFNTGLISMDHFINHLSFGNRRPARTRHQRVDHMDGAYAEHVGRPVVLAEGRDEVGFMSGKNSVTHEHYVKVVSKTVLPRRGKADHSYEYTINSNMYDVPEEAVAVTSISYDLSPLKVVVEEKGKAWIEGVTGMCAIIGGVYTCFIIFEGILNGIVGSVTKKLE